MRHFRHRANNRLHSDRFTAASQRQTAREPGLKGLSKYRLDAVML
jgi:hypothetical protein